MTRNGFAPIFESSGGSNHILHCRWTLGARPPGAAENPIVTNAADGLHSANANPGPDIEGCTFEGIFLDDCIAIHGGYQKIKAVNGSSVIVENGYGEFRAGDPARISNDHGFYLQPIVTGLKDNNNGTTTLNLDTDVKIPSDCAASNPRFDGQGYRIIGNKLGHTRSRGIIAKADNGLIRNNVIEHTGLGIRLGPEFGAGEADYSNNVVVEGNTIDQNGGTGIVIDGSGVKQNFNIVIENNHFSANFSGEIGVAWADTVVIKGNSFVAQAAWPHGKPQAAISVHDSQNVDIRGNQIGIGSSYTTPSIAIGDNVVNLTKDNQP